MKHIKSAVLLLLVCLLLTACVGNTNQSDPPTVDDQQTILPDNTPDDGSSNSDGDKQDAVRYPADLTVELVMDWPLADALLPHLNDLSDRIMEALEEAGCPPDTVTLTISTAGGFTAQALVHGGIDAAILPAVDIIPYEANAAVIALSGEDIPQTALAVSLADEELSEAFRQALFRALTETEAGRGFLSACCGEAIFSAPTEEALQAVRDYREELEKNEGGPFA